MKIILAGTIGRSGLGGQAWASLQYLLGLRALGHEVFYLEDCGDTTWVWDWEKAEWNYDLDYPAAYVNASLAPFGLGDRWIYRTDKGSRGMELDPFKDACRTADLLIMRATPLWSWREEYNWPQRRAFIDVDPGFTQITLASGDQGWLAGIARAEHRFTVAQRIGEADCPIPQTGGPWLKTLPPVYLPEWPVAETKGTEFTSIIRWQGFRDATHNGVSYGQRDQEFPAYFDLPRATSQRFRVAQMGTKPDLLTQYGWEVVPGELVSRTPNSYREFIQNSRAEFSVPKNGYVKMRGGWFSDRSVCYLASGRPVLIEDTGLEMFPTAEGLVTFTDLPGAIAGVERINADYERHCQYARALAENIFSTERILPPFLRAAMS
ncbi:MAG TPA: glycosyltransferase family 1 protein [Candidatus Angelobacter sp.]|nr:glycosyltransferase family 1 protein [Candidatus Angelobacter sp.]